MPRSETDTDPPPFQIIPAFGASRAPSSLVVICDHASSFIPERYGDLGLATEDRISHIAWDLGAEAVARLLAARLNASLILAGASRLLVDCNRAPGDAGWMPEVSCGIAVPGNQGLSLEEKTYRRRTWYDPYHNAIAQHLGDIVASGGIPIVIALHSFTPHMCGADLRPWHVGVLWNRDERLSRPVIERLRLQDGLVVGDNQPYSAQEFNHTLDTHAGRAGFPHISFEIRQDLIAEQPGIDQWATMLSGALEPLVAQDRQWGVKFSLGHA